MEISLSYVIDYVRGLDERLTDTTKYPDESIANKIKYGIDNLSAQVQPFTKEEFIGLNQYINLGLKRINIKPSEQLLGYYEIGIYQLNDFVWSKVEGVTDVIITEDMDRSLTVDIINTPTVELAIKFRYFYAPDILAVDTLIVEPEVWHFMKHSIQIVVWGALKDYNKEQYHQKVLDTHASQKILQQPVGYAPTSMKGGFI